jgi:ribosomal silencing factor RsfS
MVQDYNTTGIKYTVGISDLKEEPVPRCSKTYSLMDSGPGYHTIEGNSTEFTIPRGTEVGPYFVYLKFYSKEGGEEIYTRRKIQVTKCVGNISITKFADLNNSGKPDVNEPGLQGWEFTITDPYGESYTKTTKREGIIYLSNVPCGNYVIREVLKPEQKDMGWYNTTPLEQPVTVKEKKTTNVVFGNRISRVIIIKLNDTNQNAKIDNRDERLQGWRFNVTDPEGKTTTHITNDTGEIIIGVPEYYEGKVYTIEEELWQDWKLIEKDTNAPIIEEGISWIKIRVEKDKESKVTFLNTPISKGTLLIHKFNDSNQNQVPDYGEEGLANWEFKVAQDGRPFATCITNKTGFCVRKLEPGIYEITEVGKEGWIIERIVMVCGCQTCQTEGIQYTKGNHHRPAGGIVHQLHKKLQ